MWWAMISVLKSILELAQLVLQEILGIHQGTGALLDAVLYALQRPSIIVAAAGGTAVHRGLGNNVLTRNS